MRADARKAGEEYSSLVPSVGASSIAAVARHLHLALVDGGHERAVAIRAESQPLPTDGPIPDRGVHLRPRQRQLDGPTHLTCHLGGQKLMRPSLTGTAERATNERRDDANLVRRNAECLAVGLLAVVDALHLVPHREPVTVPRRDRGRDLHRIVVVASDRIRPVDDHRRGPQHRIGVATGIAGCRLAWLPDRGGITEFGVLRLFPAAHRHQGGTVGGRLVSGRHHVASG